MTSLRTQAQPTSPDALPLTQLARGASACVLGTDLDDEHAGHVESLGLEASARLSVCRIGDPCVVRVFDECGGSCRIGLRREICRRIMVRPLSD